MKSETAPRRLFWRLWSDLSARRQDLATTNLRLPASSYATGVDDSLQTEAFLSVPRLRAQWALNRSGQCPNSRVRALWGHILSMRVSHLKECLPLWPESLHR